MEKTRSRKLSREEKKITLNGSGKKKRKEKKRKRKTQ